MTGSHLWSWKRKLGGPELSFVDSSIYADPEIFELELEKIWRRTWLLAVHESELPNRYDYRTLTIALQRRVEQPRSRRQGIRCDRLTR